MKRLVFLIVFISIGLSSFSQSKNITISGYVREDGSRELLIGVNIYIKGTQTGTTTNNYGFYSFTFPAQAAEVVFSYVGYTAQTLKKNFDKDLEKNIFLKSSNDLSEVEVHGDRDERIANKASMSVVSIPVKQVRDIPALLGEKDVFRVLQLMPGIRGGSEASSGLYVRGGGPDQNLIILDDAPVYNAMHLFGFFSVFNGDAIKSIEMYKGGFPARYGGRLSSVIDMSLKDGNKQDFGGEASIGLLSSRLLLEGPIVKNKSSFMVSGRRTYADAVIRPFMNSSEGTVGYYFYDLNAKVNYEISDKDRIFLSGYFGRDKFSGGFKGDNNSEDYKLYWENATSTLRWNHQFTNKLFSNTSLIYSNYHFIIDVEHKAKSDFFHLNYKSGIRDFALKSDFTWVPNAKHYIRTGFVVTNHLFTPSAVVIEVSNQKVDKNVQELNSIESAVYFEDEWKIMPQMKMNAGIRLSNFIHKSKSYFGFEPRILLSYMFTDVFSIKASYAVMNQNVHLLTSSGVGLPTDLWVPATDIIGPQHSSQFAIGLARDFLDPSFTISLEGYYKSMKNIISYKEGSSFLMIEDPNNNKTDFHYEDAVTVGDGYSAGLELLIQRKFGKLTGWIGYTLSYTKYKFDELNNGKEFFPRHDRRHDFSIVGIYKLNETVTLSATWVYGTGDAITLAQSRYSAHTHNPMGNSNVDIYKQFSYFDSRYANHYNDKNSFRMESYHRLDIGVQFHKKLKKGRERTIEVSLYNAYNHYNPFFYYTAYNYQTNENELRQVTLFPILPSVSYYLKF